jgi:hypothetical protein
MDGYGHKVASGVGSAPTSKDFQSSADLSQLSRVDKTAPAMA